LPPSGRSRRGSARRSRGSRSLTSTSTRRGARRFDPRTARSARHDQARNHDRGCGGARAHGWRPRGFYLESNSWFTSTRQSVREERQVGDDREDPPEDAAHLRPVFVEVARAALLRDQDRPTTGRASHREPNGWLTQPITDEQGDAQEDVSRAETSADARRRTDRVLAHAIAPRQQSKLAIEARLS
jgi:hypothetical protein